MSKKKSEIKPSDIKANIYDSIELIIDVHGVSRWNMEDVSEKLKKILPAEKYSRTDDSLTDQEVNDYGDRKGDILSEAVRKRYLETEGIIRYISKDGSEKITISRLYISIFLSYEIAHFLSEKIELIGEIVMIFNTLDYFEVEKISIVKKDSIYCPSLKVLYHCYEKNMFADVRYTLDSKNVESEYGITSVYNNFYYENSEIVINKRITEGRSLDSDQIIFEGIIDTTVSMEPDEKNINIGNILYNLNTISFKVFMCHITEKFANELIDGRSSKDVRGINFNE
jgi:hypothetical protein